MERRARPSKMCRAANHPRPDRIQFHITQGCPQVGSIKRTRKEAVLPKVPTPAERGVRVGSIAPVRFAKRSRKCHLLARYDDPMDVVRHAAVAEQICAEALRAGLDELQINAVIAFIEEDLATIQSALCEVMRHS